nr:siderophore-interacting protein [Quadrisphaera sp. INWT6]
MRTSRVGHSYVRVTLAVDDGGPALADRGWDSWVRLFMPRPDADGAPLVLPHGPATGWYARWKELPEGTRADIRNETLRAVRTDPVTGVCEVDLDLVVHTGPDGAVTGPAGRWATTVRAGDRAGLLEQGTILDGALGLHAGTASTARSSSWPTRPGSRRPRAPPAASRPAAGRSWCSRCPARTTPAPPARRPTSTSAGWCGPPARRRGRRRWRTCDGSSRPTRRSCPPTRA